MKPTKHSLFLVPVFAFIAVGFTLLLSSCGSLHNRQDTPAATEARSGVAPKRMGTN